MVLCAPNNFMIKIKIKVWPSPCSTAVGRTTFPPCITHVFVGTLYKKIWLYLNSAVFTYTYLFILRWLIAALAAGRTIFTPCMAYTFVKLQHYMIQYSLKDYCVIFFNKLLWTIHQKKLLCNQLCHIVWRWSLIAALAVHRTISPPCMAYSFVGLQYHISQYRF